ncbi:hypothetical protein V1264_018989 [Littorina saxatilis]|uniref:Uncharacterized protein n=1 Tax=Littorina saxatilis TaxID=31220 RepID=A0AAN9BE91_9CAEN
MCKNDVYRDRFGFDVVVLKDKTKAEMEASLKAIAAGFKHPWRCFVCFFLSHGLGVEYLADFDGNRVNVRLLIKLFDGDNCPRMVGKPKLFFAQMCRGFDAAEYRRSMQKYDAAGCILFEDSLPANVSPDRDRLVCYATTEGRMAPLDPEKGSLFIQTLTKVLRVVGGKLKIEEVLGIVTNMVDKQAEEKYKVCPVFDSTLIGKLTFPTHPKNENAGKLVLKKMMKNKTLSDALEMDANMKSDMSEALRQNFQKLLV